MKFIMVKSAFNEGVSVPKSILLSRAESLLDARPKSDDHKIAEALKVSIQWVRLIRNRSIRNPGVNTVEHLVRLLESEAQDAP